MKTLYDHLAQYATYHRDRRNVWTHFVGIPVIVLSITTALSRVLLWPPLGVDAQTAGPGVGFSAAMLVSALASLFYLRLDWRYGLTMALGLGLACLLGHALAWGEAADHVHWALLAAGMFVVGWVLQFLGHYFEGRKPAFVDDMVGLLIGPLFVVAEAGFLLGLRPEVEQQVVGRAGPLH